MTTMGLGGNTPQVTHGGETPGQKRLFFSVRDIALIKDKQIRPGYGYLKAGQIMAVDSVTGELVPYVATTTPKHKAYQAGNAFAVADVADTATTISVSINDAYKFKVGQSIILVNDNSGTPVVHDGGAITGIDVTTYPHMAIITFTTAVAVATFTVARFTNCYVKTDTSTPFTKAIYVLDKDTNTGTGASALGAQTSVVISNCILYTASLIDFDTAAATDMSAVTDGAHTIFK